MHSETVPLWITASQSISEPHTQVLQALNSVLCAQLLSITSHTPVLHWTLLALANLTSSSLNAVPWAQDFTLHFSEPRTHHIYAHTDWHCYHTCSANCTTFSSFTVHSAHCKTGCISAVLLVMWICCSFCNFCADFWIPVCLESSYSQLSKLGGGGEECLKNSTWLGGENLQEHSRQQ
jgi:hypothetical protein